ncbi:hypothetical protein FKP32DRAFT_1754853 [Trametes sanguinea]|nr:hypothetical protein FKP32DRAFT_1754853 [Trametes sanguinea]
MSNPAEYEVPRRSSSPQSSCLRTPSVPCCHCRNAGDLFAGSSADAALNDLDTAAPSSLQALILSRISQLEGYVIALKHRYNANALMHRRLPPELLMQVFSQIKPSTRRDIRIAHVSRTWRSILLNTSSFWVAMFPLVTPRADRPEPSVWFRTFLQRSAVGPFALQLPYVSSQIIDVVSSHMNQLTALDVHVSLAVARSLFSMVNGEWPSLRSLSVHHVPIKATALGTESQGYLEDLRRPVRLPSNGSRRSLQTLRIATLFLAAAVPVLTLRNLEIVNCSSWCFVCHSATAPHALGMALDFLRNCHSLESLRLLRVACQEPNQPDTSLEAVKLDSLQNLSLDGTRPDIASAYLRHLIFPGSLTFKLSWSPKAHGWDFPPALIHAMSLHAADELLVEVLDTFVRLTYLTDGTARVVLRAVGLDIPLLGFKDRSFQGLVDLMSACSYRITKLEFRIFRITVKKRFLKASRMRTLLTAFPHLVSLTTQGSWRPVGLTRRFAALSSEPTLAVSLCPGLRILIIRWKIHPLNRLTIASLYDCCERMKNNLKERSQAAGRVLDLFDLTCSDTSRIPRAEGEDVSTEQMREHITSLFDGTAERVRVQIFHGPHDDALLDVA